MQDTLKKILENRLSRERSTQTTLPQFVRERASVIGNEAASTILDLGCGDGRAYEAIASLFPNAAYHGIDLEDSPEVSRRRRSDVNFHQFDGISIPFPDGYFDAIYCRQVLEHVRHPDALLSEAARVLRPGGFFLGSVSQLEPYHSHSIFNWTPYGVVIVFEDHGLGVLELAPGVDGITLTLRRLLGVEKFSEFFSSEGLANHYIEQQEKRTTAWNRNFRKIILAGHLVFMARKNGEHSD